MTCRDDALKATDQFWRDARQIHERAGVWSPTGIRHALVHLASEGLLEIRSVPAVPAQHGMKFEYRLARSKP